jgi:tetratricopeptide (TPR) repeat protein
MRTAQGVWIGLFLLLGSGPDSQAETALPDCGSDAACSPLYDRARQASGENDLPEALRFYKLAYEVRSDPRLLFNIARILHKLDRPQEAVSYYKQFLDSPLEDAEQKLKAEQYLEQIRTGRSTSDFSRPPAHSPAANPQSLPAQARKEPEISAEAAPARRPRWRLVTGGVTLGAGLLLTGFGASALAAQGQCVDLPRAPAQTCDRIYTTTPVGGALLGTGAAAVVGGIVLMAWPGR